MSVPIRSYAKAYRLGGAVMTWQIYDVGRTGSVTSTERDGHTRAVRTPYTQ